MACMGSDHGACMRLRRAIGYGPSRQAPTEEGRMAAKFVLKQGSTGKFRFNLVASNGQVIATSETYESKASAINGIESVKRNAPTAEIDDQTDQ
jgi:uncharacterized protein YegP (UPF0339 family)